MAARSACCCRIRNHHAPIASRKSSQTLLSTARPSRWASRLRLTASTSSLRDGPAAGLRLDTAALPQDCALAHQDRAPCPGQHLGWPPPASASVNICLIDPLHPCLSISAAARQLQCLHRCGSRRALPGGGGVGVAVVCVGAAALRAGAVTGRMRATRGVVGARREPVLPAGLSARIFSGFP